MTELPPLIGEPRLIGKKRDVGKRHHPVKQGFLFWAMTGMCEGRDGIYIAAGMFREYGTVGSLFAKRLVQEAIDRCLGPIKTLTVNLPSQGIATLTDQREKKRLVLHLVYAPRVCRGNTGIEVIEDALPLYDLEIRLRWGRKIGKVYTAPSGRPPCLPAGARRLGGGASRLYNPRHGCSGI